jgi:hypothetical protein
VSAASDREALAAKIRRALAEDGDTIPELTDEQIALVARLLPRPRPGSGTSTADGHDDAG